RLLDGWGSSELGVLTDDRPFPAGHDPELLPALRSASMLALAALVGVALLCLRRREGAGLWRFYFLAIGCGLMALELALLASRRSCVGDPSRTVAVITALLFGCQAAVGPWSDRLRPRSWRPLAAGLVTVVLYTAWGLRHIPFSAPGFWGPLILTAA